jgi:hypothetical protein
VKILHSHFEPKPELNPIENKALVARLEVVRCYKGDFERVFQLPLLAPEINRGAAADLRG